MGGGMTNNDIIKALECCCKNNNCEGCPLDYLTFSSQCASELAIKSLDLINRLQAQNKDLAETVHNLTIEKDALFDETEELKAEVERLNAENMLTISEKNAFRTSFYDVLKQLKTAKSEACKEFSEEIFELFPADKCNTVISRVTVKHILKELVGDDNA